MPPSKSALLGDRSAAVRFPAPVRTASSQYTESAALPRVQSESEHGASADHPEKGGISGGVEVPLWLLVEEAAQAALWLSDADVAPLHRAAVWRAESLLAPPVARVKSGGVAAMGAAAGTWSLARSGAAGAQLMPAPTYCVCIALRLNCVDTCIMPRDQSVSQRVRISCSLSVQIIQVA